MTKDSKDPVGTELPIPPNFPVAWENDEEKTYLWRWDDIHSPLPVTPMSLSLSEYAFSQPPPDGEKAPSRPSRSLRKRINGYSYSANLPSDMTAEEKEVQKKESDEMIANARSRWDNEFLPILHQNLSEMRSRDLESASDTELVEILDEFLKLHGHHWYIHGMAVIPMHTSAEIMADMYREIMDDAPDEEPYLLLQGLDNKSLETDRALQALSDEARTRPGVADIFATGQSAQEIIERLSSSDEGREFIERLDEFLSVYGYRPTGFDISFPSWKEDPTFVILNVKNYLANPPRDLEKDRAELVAQSGEYLAKILKNLEGDESRREQFIKAFENARDLWHLKEDHAFFIDQGSNATVRMLIAHIGRRLCQHGVLDAADDVFYITLDELRSALDGESSGTLKEEVKARQDEHDRFAKVIPPKFLGTMPPQGSETATSAFTRMTGPVSIITSDGDSGVIRGVPGSGGAKTGPARVVRSPAEFSKVRPGDVLVCTSTSPTWTPLFGSVSALVSDSGGALSHTAIVAREYKLPAVVGVNGGTTTITDGQLITVDGDQGVVMLH